MSNCTNNLSDKQVTETQRKVKQQQMKN